MSENGNGHYKLTPKQAKFIEAYIANNGNATDAARRAGYSGNDKVLQVTGAENLSKPMIAAAIAKRTEIALAPLRITADRVIQKTAEIAFRDEDVQYVPEGYRSIIPDKLKALDMLNRNLGNYKRDGENPDDISAIATTIYQRLVERGWENDLAHTTVLLKYPDAVLQLTD